MTLQACEQGVREIDQNIFHRPTIDAPALPAQSWDALDPINFAIPSVAVLPIPVPGTLQARSPSHCRGRSEGPERGNCSFCCLHVVAPSSRKVTREQGRFNKFWDGQWAELLDEAFRSTTVNVPRNLLVDSAERRAEVSRARQCLTGAVLALRIEETFQSMQNRRPQVSTRPISQEAREFHLDAPLDPLGHRAACVRTGRLKKRATPI